jgi:hypothetical protein
MNPQTIDANVNATKCLVTRNHLGYDTFINICSGHQQNIPWAFGDWAGAIALSCLMLLLVGLVIGGIAMLVSIWRDW